MSGFNVSDARALRMRQRAQQAAAAYREAWEERAAIIEEGAKVDRATAERWATACLERVPGALGRRAP